MGSYRVVPSATFSVGSASSYASVNYNSGTFEITKAALTVTPTNVTLNYHDAAPSYAFSLSGFKHSDNSSNLSSYVAPTCTSSYVEGTNVISSPVSISCSGGSSSNYTFNTSATGTITIQPLALSISGSTVATRAYNGNKTAGTVTAGTLSGLVSGQTLVVTGVGTDYSSQNPGTYSTTVTYTLANGAGGTATNYTLSSETLSGTVTAVSSTFTVGISYGVVTAYSNKIGTQGNPVTITSTTTADGKVSFKYSTDGTTYTNITDCQDMATSGLVATCTNWNAPTTGFIYIAAEYTPDNAGLSGDTKVFKTQIVPRPVITSFSASSGRVGTTITINGANFLGLNSVSFKGTALASGKFKATDTKITLILPSNTGTGKFTVSTLYGGSTESTATFTLNP